MKKIVNIILIFVLCIQSACVYAGWDGYGSKNDNAEDIMFDTSNVLKILDTDHVPVMSGVEGASPNSVYWEHKGDNPQICILSRGNYDLTQYNGIHMWMYSVKKTNSKIAFYVQKSGGGYFLYTMPISWEGWKELSISFDDFTVNGSYKSDKWDDVTSIDIYAHGWSIIPNPKTVLYINSVYFSSPEKSISDNSDDETVQKLMNESVCFYAGSRQYTVNGEFYTYNDNKKAIQLNGLCMIPFEYCKSAFNDDFSISKDGEVLYKSNSTGIKCTNINSVNYLSAENFGTIINGNVVSYKNLVIITKNDAADKVRTNDALLKAVSRKVTENKIDYSKITQTDIDLTLDKWEKYLTGSEADPNDEYIKQKRSSVEQNARYYQQEMNRESDAKILWGTDFCKTTAEMGQQYSYIYQMALGYSTPGINTYKDSSLKNDIIYALDWGYDHLYGPAEVKNEGWRNTSDYNWLEWNIIVPREVSRTILLLRNDISKDKINKYFDITDYFLEEKFGPLLTTFETGANTADRVYAYALSKLIRSDAVSAAEALSLVKRDLAYTTSLNGDGQREDGSYKFHKYYAMNGLYALSFMTAVVPIITITSETKFEIDGYNSDEYTDWLIKSYQNCIYEGKIMSMFRGREPGDEKMYGQSIIGNLIEYSETVGNDDRIKLQSFIKYLAKEKCINEKSFSVNQYRILKNIISDESVPVRESYVNFNMFYSTDKAVWQNNNYAVALSMSSSRISGWESINGENKKGWYMGDGMVYLYTKNDTGSYENTFWKDVNYYRLPGITADTRTRKAESIRDSQIYLSSQDFAGGVKFDDVYGTAAMILESCHNENKSDYTSEYGNALPYHENDLMAKKAYFVFDDEMIMLGSGINSTMNSDVETVVENRLSSNVKKLSENTAEKYDIVSVKASSEPQAENAAVNVIDDDYDTRWSAENDQTLIAELSEIKEIGMVGIAVYNGTSRQNLYDIYLSDNGSEWTQIFSGKSSGNSDSLEVYDGKRLKAKYIKFDFHGNTLSSWNSITEIAVFPPRADNVIALPEANNIPSEKLIIDGNIMPDDTDVHEVKNPKWANLENTCGYVFLESANVFERKVSNTKSAFTELWINHGKNPTDATYAYAMLPLKNAEETKAYSENPDVEILSNTGAVQAVREKKLGITSIVFYEKSSVDGVGSDKPCIVMIKKDDAGALITVSDPTQKENKIKIEIDLGNLSFDSELSDSGVSYENGEITFNVAKSGGRSFTAEFKS